LPTTLSQSTILDLLTQAKTEIFLLISKEVEFETLTQSSLPSKLKAPPTLPVVQVGQPEVGGLEQIVVLLYKVPLFPNPLKSLAVVPLPSSKLQ
jgi:hypothetical protein